MRRLPLRRLLSTSTPRPRRSALRSAAAAAVVGGGAAVAYLATPEQSTVTLTGDEHVDDVDALIVGGGIMGATVGLMLKLLHPSWSVRIIEQHDRVGAECSNEWNNAGTGHAALCEPNYTPLNPKTGEVDISKAIAVNAKFLVSLQFWTYLVERGVLPDGSFIQPAPHLTFVHGDAGVDWLRKRVAKLKVLPSFAATEMSEDYDQIKKWVPLLCSGRPREGGEPIACSRHPDGTEVNYGLLTRGLVQSFSELGGEVHMLSTVVGLTQEATADATDGSNHGGRWLVAVKKNDLSRANSVVRAKYVFAGAGGGSLRILQKAGLPEVKGYAGMPISGKFLVCQKPEIVAKNTNKVYGRAAIGAPPMSVPHLDWRTIYGKDVIFFGPFAGFSPTVFKLTGGIYDWLSTLNIFNVLPMVAMAVQNLPLVKFLAQEVLLSNKESQLETLREFVPDARPEDWTMVWAGQRVQIVKPDAKTGGRLQFGTEVVASKDKTIVGLLGASPGASVSPFIAIEVLDHFACADNEKERWHATMGEMIPTYGRDINADPKLYEALIKRARDILLHGATSGHHSSKANIGAMFDRLDIDKDGSLSPRELRRHLRATGVEEKNIKALIATMDKDKNGSIDRDEFTAGFAHFLSGGVAGPINRRRSKP